MDKREKLLLIDGYSIVNRAFYGIPPLTNSEGLHTNAIMGFLNIFLKAYSEYRPEYVLVAFDARAKTFRHELYAEYKGTRKGMPDELHEQVPPLKEALSSMGIRYAEVPGFEADDIIGTCSRRAAGAGMDVVILSGDRDLLQLASDTTLVAIPKTKGGVTETENYYAADVIEKYNVTPEQFIDLKALMGDASDNIPGIPKIGVKTASAIISKFGSLENAYAHADEVTPKRASESLKENIETGRLSKVLATIVTDAPVSVDISECRADNEAAFFNGESYRIFKRLELKKLLERFDVSAAGSVPEAEYVFTAAGDFPAELSGPAGLFVAPGGAVTALCSGEGTFVYEGCPENITAFLKSGTQVRCFALKELLHTISAKDIRQDCIYDLEIMAYLLDPLLPEYNFDEISKDYLGRIIPSKADLIGKKSFEQAFAEDRETTAYLAALEARTAYDAFVPLKEALERAGMWELFTDMEMPLAYSLYYMEKEGVSADRDALAAYSARLLSMADDLQERIYRAAGEEFNINSPVQLGTVLFDKLKLPHGKKTKRGYSTAADVLEKLAPDFPIVSDILKYRQVVKLRSTYAEGLAEYIGEDGRIHGTFNQTVTATGRISSAEPNLQNIPIRTELGQDIRKAFTAKEGCIFLDADYSQIELRLLAHLSGDKNLIEAYMQDADIHRATAAKVFNTPLDEVTPQQRRNAKAVNFGIVYGISSFGLSQDLSITRGQAQEYIKQYFETYPDVKKYLDSTVEQAKKNGYVRTMFGRRRPIPELSSGNFMQRSFGERAAMNSPIQGSAADIIKIAMINAERALNESGLSAKIVLQIHDELLVEVKEEDADAAAEILVNEMRGAASLSVPLEVGIGRGRNWFEAH